MSKVKQQDVVSVLPGCSFQSLVYASGIVVQALPFGMAIVRFAQKQYHLDPDTLEHFCCSDWILPSCKLKVLDSPHDNRIGDMEEEIQSLEADLALARSCLSISEELREQQAELIKKLIEDNDVLRKGLYLAKGSSNS